MLKFSVLGSGSSGNASFIEAGRISVLVDCGFSYPNLKQRLESVGRSVKEIDAIFLTHEHADHIRGLKRFLQFHPVPVFLTRGTYEVVAEMIEHKDLIEFVKPGERFSFGGLNVCSYSVTHDANEPVNYVFEQNGCKLGFATDCGYPTKLMISKLRGCRGIVVESNYCPDMLMIGPYPFQVKQRIKSNYGHLSNIQMAELLMNVLDDGLRIVVIGHISENNNHVEKIRDIVSKILLNKDIEICISTQNSPTPLLNLS
ncbi:MAG: MBL fold metallo-hydrolase [Candidatus Hydrogenedentes bacterium]|nr:MBL fold metallo-hydrolase [Candidatus Hydrogenedentota bacterium]